jgi:aspartate/methionine/tyrosine aminotransferase
MAYTPGMIVADAVAANLAKASWIRRMFEEGARLKQERGADKVFDFTLGNPEIEPPPAVLAAARRATSGVRSVFGGTTISRPPWFSA